MAVTQVKYEALNYESGAGKKSEIYMSLSCNFPLTSVPSLYNLAYVYERLDLLMNNLMNFLKPHVLWLFLLLVTVNQ